MTPSAAIPGSEARSWISRLMSRSIARRFAHTSTRFCSFSKPSSEDTAEK